MNILPFEKQVMAIAALTEGCSIRATERLTGTHRDSIMRLGVRVGQGCEKLHDRLMRELQVPLIELDEIWAFVGKKQRKATPGTDEGDQYTFIALDAVNKAIISHPTGKRTAVNTQKFIDDIGERVVNRPQISSDAFDAYPDAIEMTFGYWADYGQIIKSYKGEPAKNAARRYSPGYVTSVARRVVSGVPQGRISTSYVERQNLTVRMSQRRFTGLTNAFSKKLENHCAAVALYVAHYNLCRVHEALRITPAMALDVTDHIWEIGELVTAALEGTAPTLPGERRGRFRVIDGGLS